MALHARILFLIWIFLESGNFAFAFSSFTYDNSTNTLTTSRNSSIETSTNGTKFNVVDNKHRHEHKNLHEDKTKSIHSNIRFCYAPSICINKTECALQGPRCSSDGRVCCPPGALLFRSHTVSNYSFSANGSAHEGGPYSTLPRSKVNLERLYNVHQVYPEMERVTFEQPIPLPGKSFYPTAEKRSIPNRPGYETNFDQQNYRNPRTEFPRYEDSRSPFKNNHRKSARSEEYRFLGHKYAYPQRGYEAGLPFNSKLGFQGLPRQGFVHPVKSIPQVEGRFSGTAPFNEQSRFEGSTGRDQHFPDYARRDFNQETGHTPRTSSPPHLEASHNVFETDLGDFKPDFYTDRFNLQTLSGPVRDLLHKYVYKKCGQRNAELSHLKRSSLPGNNPWLAAVLGWTSPEGYGLRCTATVVHPYLLITSARCLQGVVEPDLKIVMGSSELLGKDAIIPPIERAVANVFIHEKYNQHTSSHDVGLVVMASPVNFQFTPHVAPACLEAVNSLETNCYVVSWNDNPSPFLPVPWGSERVLSGVNIIEDEGKCQERISLDESDQLGLESLSDEMKCVTGNANSRFECISPGSGALMCEVAPGDCGEASCPSSVHLAGVVTWSNGGCGREAFAVVTEVSAYLPWVTDLLSAAGGLDNYNPEYFGRFGSSNHQKRGLSSSDRGRNTEAYDRPISRKYEQEGADYERYRNSPVRGGYQRYGNNREEVYDGFSPDYPGNSVRNGHTNKDRTETYAERIHPSVRTFRYT